MNDRPLDCQSRGMDLPASKEVFCPFSIAFLSFSEEFLSELLLFSDFSGILLAESVSSRALELTTAIIFADDGTLFLFFRRYKS